MIITEPKSENALQAQICTILNYLQLPYFSIPNGTYKKNIRTRNIFLATGLKSGVPDLFICRAFSYNLIPYNGCFIEVKLGVKGKVTPNQKDWHERLRAERYYVAVVRSLRDLYIELLYCYPAEANRIHNINQMINNQHG
jgi:hypothetical protein